MSLREGVLMHLDKQANGLIAPTGTSLRIWRAAWADWAMIPYWERRIGESRMLCADKLWRLGGHDPYSRIMIRHFGRDPSGIQSVAGCGKCQ